MQKGDRQLRRTDLTPPPPCGAAQIVGENAQAHGVGTTVRVITVDRLNHREISSRSPFDLICVSIFALPFRRPAVPTSHALALDALP